MISAELSQKTRHAIYKRDGYRCALCDLNSGLQIHHVIPRSQGGGNNVENLITLCWVCHNVAHGTRFPKFPDLDRDSVEQACVEYLSDNYTTDWYPRE